MNERNRDLRWAIAASAVVAVTIGLLGAHDPVTGRVTWNSDIARIVEARCVRCHSPGGRGPMSLRTYEDARQWARAMREKVVARDMPKWHAARGYGDFANDPSLTPFEISLFAAWADGGAPLGSSAPSDDTKPAQPAIPEKTSELLVRCTRQGIPPGVLVGLRPQLAEGASVGVAVRRASGSRTVLAWIRNFEARFSETYWLREPYAVKTGDLFEIDGDERCWMMLIFSAPR